MLAGLEKLSFKRIVTRQLKWFEKLNGRDRPGTGRSLLAEKYDRIDRKSALGRNQCSQHAEQRHGQDNSCQYQRIARGCLIHDGSQDPASKDSEEQSGR